MFKGECWTRKQARHVSTECPSIAKDGGKERQGAQGEVPGKRTTSVARAGTEPKHTTDRRER